MAIFKVSPYITADTRVADIDTFSNGNITNATSTSYTLTSNDGTASFYVTGTGFTYSGGRPVSGTNTGITEHLNTYGFDAYVIVSESLDVATVALIVATGDAAALNAYSFRFDDQLFGSPNADTLFSYDGNDVVTGGGGNDRIDGGAGIDTAVYSGPRSAYTITQSSGDTFTVTDTRPGSPDGVDTLTNVELLRFSDGVIGISPPVLGAVQSTATAPAATSVVLQPTITITDPDVGASVISAQVVISSGFTTGDRLTVESLPTGVIASFNGSTGVLALTGAGSDSDYQAALRTVGFVHDGSAVAGSRTVSFTVTDDQGIAAQTVAETVAVSAYNGAPPVTVPINSGPTNLDAQQGFPTQTFNLLRASATDPALQTPSSPLYAQASAEKGIAAQLDSGQIGVADAQNALYHLVDGTTSVAEISYAFFTGQTPTEAGLNYLVHSAANPTDLNDQYYAQFSTENRYINFATSLSTGQGAGAVGFQAAYGSLPLTDATAKAYAAVFGIIPTADKVDAILNTQVSNGSGGTESRAQYLSDITDGTSVAQKAAVVGFLLADSVKEGFGLYQQADLHFLQDLSHGTALYGTDLLAAYTQTPTLVGQPIADAALGG